jgi:superfamily II DNA or RNA helicase
LIPDCKQISGKDSDERKEELFIAFSKGELRVLVTKPKIGAWGLNWQHCAHTTVFPSHSFEQYYQSVRRFLRFGQKRPVVVDIITTEGEKSVMKNLQRKAVAADKMFSDLVANMNDSLAIDSRRQFNQTEEIPTWLRQSNS